MCRGGALVTLIVVAGCGRFGFSGEPGSSDAPGSVVDAAPLDAGAPRPLHHYRLDGNLRDDHGGLDLSALGGSLDSAGYRFPSNMGLELTTGMPVGVYTIDLKLSLDDMTYWRKIIDFKGRTIDEGLYAYLSTLSFVEEVSPETVHMSPALLVAGAPFEVTLTRDAAGVVTGYVDRVLQFSFTDSVGIGTFTQAGRAVFTTDDTINAEPEACSGIMREIRIWDVALTADQIATLAP
jgi:hypothetical protein